MKTPFVIVACVGFGILLDALISIPVYKFRSDIMQMKDDCELNLPRTQFCKIVAVPESK